MIDSDGRATRLGQHGLTEWRVGSTGCPIAGGVLARRRSADFQGIRAQLLDDRANAPGLFDFPLARPLAWLWSGWDGRTGA